MLPQNILFKFNISQIIKTMKKIITFLFIFNIAYSQAEFPSYYTDCQQTANVAKIVTPLTDSIIIAGGVIRGTFSNTVGTKGVWKFIGTQDGHDKVFFDSVNAQPSGVIRVYYPKVSKVVSFVVNGDEILSKYATFGSGVNDTYADIFVGQNVVNGGELKGNNTKDWVKSSGAFTLWDIVRDSTGLTRLNINYAIGIKPTVFDYQKLAITYTGSNVRLIKRVYNFAGNYSAAFYLTDIYGNIIKGNSDVNDRVVLTSGLTTQNVNCYSTGGDLMQTYFFPAMSNIWILAEFKK